MSSACNSAVHLRPSDSTPWCSTTELHTLYGEQGPIQIGISNGPCSPWSLYGLVVEHQSAESKGLRFNSSLGLMRWFLWWDKKKSSSISLPTLKLILFLFYWQNIMISTLLIPEVFRTHVIYELQNGPCSP